jgi:hypothetical protein
MRWKIILTIFLVFVAGFAIVYAQANVPRTAERWEYTLLDISGLSQSSAIQRANELGGQGWEHAEGIPGTHHRMLFKRRLQ